MIIYLIDNFEVKRIRALWIKTAQLPRACITYANFLCLFITYISSCEYKKGQRD